MNQASVMRELKAHLPYSIFFTAAGIILAGLLTYVSLLAQPQAETDAHAGHDQKVEHSEEAGGCEDAHCDHSSHEPATGFEAASGMLFHIFHPIHLLLSAMATTAMFYRHERKIGKAVIVGLAGSLGVCGVSDIFLPYLCGGLIKSSEIHFHWCLLEHPMMVLPFSAIGVIAGLLAAYTVHNSTVISHSAHVFVSSTASLFYLISFGITAWYVGTTLSAVFGIVILAVTIPCCLSDVWLPALVAREEGGDYSCCGHKHDHEDEH